MSKYINFFRENKWNKKIVRERGKGENNNVRWIFKWVWNLLKSFLEKIDYWLNFKRICCKKQGKQYPSNVNNIYYG